MAPPEVSAVSRAPRRPRRHVVHRVVMDQRAAPAAAGAKALRQHADHGVEIGARQRPIGPGAAEQREELVLAPLARRHFGDDLLRQHVERLFRDREAIEFPAVHTVEQRRAFDQLVARQREQPALGRPRDRVARAADPLQKSRDRARRAELADQVDIADVDAELQRGGRHQGFQRAAFEPLFGIEPLFFGEAAVMRGHLIGAEPLGELAGHPLDQPAGIDEDQGRPMRLDQLGEAIIDLLPDLARHHRFERRRRHFEGEVARAPVTGVDDPALRFGADQEARDRLDRLLGGRQADAQQRPGGERRQALERQRQMRAALVRRQRVDLVDDHGARRRQHLAAGFGAEQDVERFRRGHDDVRRGAPHALALRRRRVAGAHPGADLDLRQAPGAQLLAHSGERRFEVALDVVRQRLERRDVDDLRLVRQAALQPLPHQRIDRREKGRQRLARSGGRSDQHVPPGLDRRPRCGLRRRRRGKAVGEPGGDRGMEQGGRVAHIRNTPLPVVWVSNRR